MEEKYLIELNIAEIQAVLQGLAKLPYEVSAEIIHKVRVTVQETQLKKEKEEKAKTKK